MDIIYIKQLTVSTIIGIYEWEQKKKQKLLLDIYIRFNIKKAAINDDISYSINYVEISKIITKYIETHKFKLIEKVAEETANIILKNFNINLVRIKVHKPSAIKQAKNVSIIIERKKNKNHIFS